jgi:hypothetical protein
MKPIRLSEVLTELLTELLNEVEIADAPFVVLIDALPSDWLVEAIA